MSAMHRHVVYLHVSQSTLFLNFPLLKQLIQDRNCTKKLLICSKKNTVNFSIIVFEL